MIQTRTYENNYIHEFTNLLTWIISRGAQNDKMLQMQCGLGSNDCFLFGQVFFKGEPGAKHCEWQKHIVTAIVFD